MELHRCSSCARELPGCEFYKRTNGKLNSSRCKSCMKQIRDRRLRSDPEFARKFREYNRAFQKTDAVRRYHRDKRKKLDSFYESLKSGPCADCGKTYPTCVMDFDHRDPSSKRFTIASKMKSAYTEESKQAVLDEVAKCDLVCSNCHRIRTWIMGRRKTNERTTA